MKRKIVILLLIIFIGGLLFPFLTLAGDYEVDGKNVHYEGLVPCGKAKVSSGESDEVTQRCQFCHLFVMLDGIITFVLFDILPPVAVLMMVIAGVMFFFGGGNPSLLLQAKKLITSIVIGLVIIFSAYLIVGAVLSATGVLGWTTLDKWLDNGTFTVNCPIAGVVTPGEEEEEEKEASDYTTKDECIDAGYYWYDGACHEEPKESTISTNPDDLYQQTVTSTCEAGQTLVGDGICTTASITTVVTKSESFGVNGWLCEFTDAGVYTVPLGTLTKKCTETPGPSLGQKATIEELEKRDIQVNNPCTNGGCNNSLASCGPGADEDTSVCVDGLPDTIINKLGDIKDACDDVVITGCDVVITGGTETFGHSNDTPHGYGEAVVDLRKTSGLEDWLMDNSDVGGDSWCSKGYVLKDGSAWFCDEGDHFHFELL